MRSAEPPEPDGRRPWILGDVRALVEARLGDRGLGAASYGTERWLRGEPGRARLAWRLTMAGGHGPLVEALMPETWSRYENLGISPAVCEETDSRKGELSAAWSLLGELEDLGATALALVRSVHLIESCGPGYDVSHSDPELPCSIFLSIPTGERHVALRVAESILHEAMHLQLTLVEARWPLVNEADALMGYSPWQLRERPLLGLLHGIYVFTAVDRWMAELASSGRLDRESRAFAEKRRVEIAEEIAQVRRLGESCGLTDYGRQLATTLLDRPEA